jgi:hypothetical protein
LLAAAAVAVRKPVITAAVVVAVRVATVLVLAEKTQVVERLLKQPFP